LTAVILSDISIRKALAEGRIVIDPLDESAIQPSSVDLRVDRYFRVFRNDTTPYIDPKQPQENLTELVEVKDENAFILHPGEFVLGSTLERVALPNDLVARLEGKSSLGRLGLLIHSSLPASEPVLVRHDGRFEAMAIGDIVRKQLEVEVIGFDPDTFEVGFHRVTGWFEGPADRIFEVRLRSGRRVRVTAGHNLFTLDRDGRIAKLRTAQLHPGTKVAVPRSIPEPLDGAANEPMIDLLARLAEPALTSVPDPDRVLVGAGVVAGLDDVEPMQRLARHVDGDLLWDEVVTVTDTGECEAIFDLEVRPGGRAIENFLAGAGGVFVSNTAGFVDAGWDGYLTLELSNVANLPIAIYPGMKIGQISFLQMTTAAETPYGSGTTGSKYQGQRGPTPSRYYLNFRP
jgi:deoxycytidine triphosphate deaminase